MKRIMLIAVLCAIMSILLVGWALAQEGQPVVETQQEQDAGEQAVEEPAAPQVIWGDYRYTFTRIEPTSDIDPQSVLMNWFSPSLYKANWQGANYVQLYVEIEWLTNDRPLDYMPLQLVLVNGGSRYILFGKSAEWKSYLWRRGNHYLNDLGARFPDHVGDKVKVIYTFDTNGASIDPGTAYIEINGMLEVWDWALESDTYTYHTNPYSYQQPLYWNRNGSSYFTYTHLGNLSLSEISHP